MIRNKYSAKAKIPRPIFPDAKPQWYNLWPLWITAVATLLYFIATVGMWFTMKGTLDQTKKQINIQQTEISSRLRPMVYLDAEMPYIIDKLDRDSITIDFIFKNYGSVTAKELVISVRVKENKIDNAVIDIEGPRGLVPPGGKTTVIKKFSKAELTRGCYIYYNIWYKNISEVHPIYHLKGIVLQRNTDYHINIGWIEEKLIGSLNSPEKVFYNDIWETKNN